MTDKDDDLLLEWVALHHRPVPGFPAHECRFYVTKIDRHCVLTVT